MSNPFHTRYQPASWHADTYSNKPEKDFADNVLNTCLGLQLTIDMARQAYLEIQAGDDEPLLQPHQADWLLLQAISSLAMLEAKASGIIDLRNRQKKEG